MGADIVKVSYTGGRASFKALVEACPRPVVIAGGPHKETIREVLEIVEDAMACGAIGIVLGRNIWQSPNPTRLTAAMADIIHNGSLASELELPEELL